MSLFFAGALSIGWIMSEHHVPSFWEVYLIAMFMGAVLLLVGLLWTLYIALEPFVRRRWPQVLVTWTRLSAGDWRDPLVGRDVLIGCAAGTAAGCLGRLQILAPSWFGYPESELVTPLIEALSGAAPFVSRLGTLIAFGVLNALAPLFLLFVLRILLRNQWAAAAVLTVILTTPTALQIEAPWIGAPIAFTATALGLFVLMRYGAIASFVLGLVTDLSFTFPSTFQTSAWYAGAGYAGVAIIAAVSLFAFQTSLGGRRLLDFARAEA